MYSGSAVTIPAATQPALSHKATQTQRDHGLPAFISPNEWTDTPLAPLVRSARCFCSPMPSHVPTSMSPSTLVLAYLALLPSQRLSTDTTPTRLAPAAAAASSCVPTATSATPMACAASAPPSLQVRANHHDASSSDTRCRRSFTLRVHHHASHADGVRCPRTSISPNACQPSRRLPFPAPDAAAALLCAFTMNSGTPMARAASAPSSPQASAYRLDASPSGTR